ncbi:MAG: DUF4386 domain-containing protein [Pseudomonadota bacterium]
MTLDHQSIASAKAMARLAGLSYLIYIAAGLYKTFFTGPGVSAFADPAAITPAAEALYRQVLLTETVLYLFVVIAAASMFATLRIVSSGLAAVGGALRLTEAVLGAGFILFNYAAFVAVTGGGLVEAFSEPQRAALNSLFVSVYGSALFFLLIFMGVGATIFFFLFYRSRFIPRWLAAWGMLTYTVMVVLSAAIILHPPFKEHVMLFFMPGSLFELVAGLWLLIAGINTQHWEDRHRS